MRARVGLLTTILFMFVGTGLSADPFATALQVVRELYLAPLHLGGAHLAVCSEPFLSSCSASAISVKVSVRDGDVMRVLLTVHLFVVGEHVQFLSASGAALNGRPTVAPAEAMADAQKFLSKINGWVALEEPARHGARDELVEIRMRDPQPWSDTFDVKTIVFSKRLGVPVVVGAPPAPTADNCGPPPQK